MTDNVLGATVRFAVFALVCLLGAFVLMAVFAQWRFQDENVYRADFTSVSGLKVGDFVRIAGVEVGKVKRISVTDQAVAEVEFSADDSVVLTEGTKAAIRWANPIGDRYMALQEGAGGVKRLNPGESIPIARTEPALDLDTLLGGFRPLFRALNPEQVNALSAQLIQAFQDQGATIGSFLNQAATLTNTLADRDELIGQVITNLNTVLGSLGDQHDQFAKAIESFAQLMHSLAERRSDISTAIAYTNASAGSIADLLQQSRPYVRKAVAQTDRAAGIVMADQQYFDDLLNTLPDTYKALSRVGLNGDYFAFYLCDLLFKVNGKGGQPVYIKVAGQDTGRCAPK